MKEIVVFEIDEKCPFEEWLNSLKDIKIKYRINERLKRIRFGNFGDCKKNRQRIVRTSLNVWSRI